MPELEAGRALVTVRRVLQPKNLLELLDRARIVLACAGQLAPGHKDQRIDIAVLLVPVEYFASEFGLARVDVGHDLGVRARPVAWVPGDGLIQRVVHLGRVAELEVALREQEQRVRVVGATLESPACVIQRGVGIPDHQVQLRQPPHDVRVVLVELEGLLQESSRDTELLGLHRLGSLLKQSGRLGGVSGHAARSGSENHGSGGCRWPNCSRSGASLPRRIGFTHASPGATIESNLRATPLPDPIPYRAAAADLLRHAGAGIRRGGSTQRCRGRPQRAGDRARQGFTRTDEYRVGPGRDCGRPAEQHRSGRQRTVAHRGHPDRGGGAVRPGDR